MQGCSCLTEGGSLQAACESLALTEAQRALAGPAGFSLPLLCQLMTPLPPAHEPVQAPGRCGSGHISAKGLTSGSG